LFISKPDGSELRQLTSDAHYDRWPEWSPKGDVIAFYSDRTGNYEIWTVTPAGQPKQITNDPSRSLIYPRWSPTGRLMTASEPAGRNAVIVFDPARPMQEQTPTVLPPPAGQGTFLGLRPVWSPDETKIAGAVSGGNGPPVNTIMVYDLVSNQYSRVPNTVGQVLGWLGNGELLVGAEGLLALVNPTTGARRPVTMPMTLSNPSFIAAGEARLSRDQKTIFFSVAVNEMDVWMVTLGKR
jgi:Tol biopolymer transport system component